jgi:hypothetical protein
MIDDKDYIKMTNFLEIPKWKSWKFLISSKYESCNFASMLFHT